MKKSISANEVLAIRQCSHLSREQCDALIAEMEGVDWSSRVGPGDFRDNEIAYQKVRFIVNRAKELVN
jgi:hypothetical protein